MVWPWFGAADRKFRPCFQLLSRNFIVHQFPQLLICIGIVHLLQGLLRLHKQGHSVFVDAGIVNLLHQCICRPGKDRKRVFPFPGFGMYLMRMGVILASCKIVISGGKTGLFITNNSSRNIHVIPNPEKLIQGI